MLTPLPTAGSLSDRGFHVQESLGSILRDDVGLLQPHGTPSTRTPPWLHVPRCPLPAQRRDTSCSISHEQHFDTSTALSTSESLRIHVDELWFGGGLGAPPTFGIIKTWVHRQHDPHLEKPPWHLVMLRVPTACRRTWRRPWSCCQASHTQELHGSLQTQHTTKPFA